MNTPTLWRCVGYTRKPLKVVGGFKCDCTHNFLWVIVTSRHIVGRFSLMVQMKAVVWGFRFHYLWVSSDNEEKSCGPSKFVLLGSSLGLWKCLGTLRLPPHSKRRWISLLRNKSNHYHSLAAFSRAIFDPQMTNMSEIALFRTC